MDNVMVDIKLMQGDCLERMKEIPDGSVDMVLCDLPYGTTACKWDSVIPFEPLWEQYRRIAKKNAAIVLTASQPFTTALIASNMREFKYELIWDKGRGFEPQLANIRPMKAHENVLVFCRQKTPYNAQMVPCEPRTVKRKSLNKADGTGQNIFGSTPQTKTYTARFPTSIVKFYSNKVAVSVYTGYAGSAAAHTVIQYRFALVGVGTDQVFH